MQKTMVDRVLLICPLKLKASQRGRKIYRINFNEVIALNYMTYNNLKRAYCDHMADQLEDIMIKSPVTVSYRVYKASNRKLDKMNVISITSKFLMDAITHWGCWEDDNDDVIKNEILLPTKLDRDYPRVEVLIKTIK